MKLNQERTSIDWIFDLEGEEGFRKRESEMLDEVKNSIVLSTGGGIIYQNQIENYCHRGDCILSVYSHYNTSRENFKRQGSAFIKKWKSK